MMPPMSSTVPRRAKIVCTIGPASNTPEVIGQLIDAGLNVARLNFSHGTHADHEKVFRTVRQEASARDVAVAILADLQGPKIRVGQIPDPGIDLIVGETLVFSVDPATVCVPGRVSIDYPRLAAEASPGDRILMDDGNLEVRIKAIEGDDIITTVVVGGVLKARKGVNLPGIELSVTAISEKDRA
ncbi:MAG TPA: pyruvate kinase, partial [Nannocystis exedens]|nr:pyruvate kinase [Nannocystis exedens]